MENENNEKITADKKEDKFGMLISFLFLVIVFVGIWFLLKHNPEIAQKETIPLPANLVDMAEKEGVSITQNKDGTITIVDGKEGTTTIINGENPTDLYGIAEHHNIELSINPHLPTGISYWYHVDGEDNNINNQQIITQMLFSSNVFENAHFDNIYSISQVKSFELPYAYINILVTANSDDEAVELEDIIQKHITPSNWTWRADYDSYSKIKNEDVRVFRIGKHILILYVDPLLIKEHNFPTADELNESFKKLYQE